MVVQFLIHDHLVPDFALVREDFFLLQKANIEQDETGKGIGNHF